MPTFAHSHTVFLNRDMVTVGPRQLDHLEGHVVLPIREDSNSSDSVGSRRLLFFRTYWMKDMPVLFTALSSLPRMGR